MKFNPVLLFVALLFLAACSGGGGGETTDTIASDNSGLQDDNSNNNDPNPTQPTDPKDPKPQPSGPQPGDIVERSETHPSVTYPAVGSPVDYTINPFIEPNTDVIGPVVQIMTHPNAYIPQDNGTINLWAADNQDGIGLKEIQCKTDQGQWEKCSTQVDVSQLDDGQHVFQARAVDHDGNMSGEVSYVFHVDTQDPLIAVQQTPNSIVYIGVDNPLANFDINDGLNGSPVTTSCTLNGEAIACDSGLDINLPTTDPQNYQLVIVATDAAGNSNQTTISWRSRYPGANTLTDLTVGGVRPVDILFIIDNSGSMDYERSNLSQRIDGMIDKIQGLDWQIAITSTDATNNDWKSDGQLLPLSNGNYILDSSMDTATAQSLFGETVQGFPNGSGNEEGIYSAARVIERHLAGQSEHVSFLRTGADLSVVILSDEDEASNGTNARITPQQFIDFVTDSFNGQKNMVFHSIITRPGDSTCLSGEGYSYGNTYDALSRLTGYGEVGGAIIGSVCEMDYASQLADIGQSVKDLRNSIKLDCEPYDENDDGDFNVSVEFKEQGSGVFVPYSSPFQIQGDRLIFSELLQPGEYKAYYQCIGN